MRKIEARQGESVAPIVHDAVAMARNSGERVTVICEDKGQGFIILEVEPDEHHDDVIARYQTEWLGWDPEKILQPLPVPSCAAA